MFLFGNWLTNFFAHNHSIGKFIQHFSTRIGDLNQNRVLIFSFDDPLILLAIPCKKIVLSIVILTPHLKLWKNNKTFLKLLSFLSLCAKIKKIKNANSHF